MNKNFANKIKPLLSYAILPLLFAALLFVLIDTTSKLTREVHSENGVWDLRDFDFENYNALLTGDVTYIPPPELIRQPQVPAAVWVCAGAVYLTCTAAVS